MALCVPAGTVPRPRALSSQPKEKAVASVVETHGRRPDCELQRLVRGCRTDGNHFIFGSNHIHELSMCRSTWQLAPSSSSSSHRPRGPDISARSSRRAECDGALAMEQASRVRARCGGFIVVRRGHFGGHLRMREHACMSGSVGVLRRSRHVRQVVCRTVYMSTRGSHTGKNHNRMWVYALP